MHDKIDEQRNPIERLIARVPGFRGYLEAEDRREADKVLRDFGVSRLERVVSELHDATKAAPLEQMDEFQEVVNQAEKLRNEMRHADRGYSGFFDEVKWDRPETLQALYDHDETVVESVCEMESHVNGGDFELADLRKQIRQLSRTLGDRKSAILGLIGE